MNTEIDRLAALIRRVDGDHRLGAAALAEALIAGGVWFADDPSRPATEAEISDALGSWRQKVREIRERLA